MAPKRYSFYPVPILVKVIEERVKSDRKQNDPGRTQSGLIAAIADRYSEIVRRHMPELTVEEWCLIFDVMNGAWNQDNAALSTQGIAHNVADGTTLDGLGEKWKVNGLDLAQRIDAMSFAEKVAILDTAERFWAMGCEDGETYDDIVARLTRSQSPKNRVSVRT